MPRPPVRVIVLVGILCVSAIFGVAVAQTGETVDFETLPEGESAQPVAPPDFDSTERLVLADSGAVTGVAAVRSDPTATTADSFQTLAAEYRGHIVRADMRAANGSEGELGVISDELDRLEGEIVAALEREQRLHEARARGEMDDDEFLRKLTYLHLRSERLNAELESLSGAIRGVTAPVTQDDAQRLRGEVSQAQLEVQTLQGPLTERAAQSIRGVRSPPNPVMTQVSESGYVLATIDDAIYVRQSLAADNRQRGTGARFSDIDTARELTAGLYPWTVNEAIESEDIPRGEIYSTTIDHPHGSTGIFIDGATERPFRDNHELDLFSLPTQPAITEEYDNVSIAVERTYPGGPTQVILSEPSTGEPIADVPVIVDHRRMGETDTDGDLWFVAPAESFEVTLVLDGEAVTVPVTMGG